MPILDLCSEDPIENEFSDEFEDEFKNQKEKRVSHSEALSQPNLSFQTSKKKVSWKKLLTPIEVKKVNLIDSDLLNKSTVKKVNNTDKSLLNSSRKVRGAIEL